MKKIKIGLVIVALLIVYAPFLKANATSISQKTTKIPVGGKTTIMLYNNNSKVKWSTSNKKIKIVKKKNNRATIKGVKTGKSVLTAKVGKKKYKCKVTVTKKEIIKYEISDQNVYYEESSYKDGGRFYAFIEITNTGNVPLYLGNATFDLEDTNGHLVLTEDSVNTAPDFIYPGEKGYYYNQFGTSVNMTREEFNTLVFVPHVNVVKTTKTLSQDYKLYDLSLGTDATLNVPAIMGRVKNDTKKDLSYIYLHAFFYDADGRIIGITGLNMSDIKAGEEKSFSISTLYAGIQKDKTIANYKVYARGTYYQYK